MLRNDYSFLGIQILHLLYLTLSMDCKKKKKKKGICSEKDEKLENGSGDDRGEKTGNHDMHA